MLLAVLLAVLLGPQEKLAEHVGEPLPPLAVLLELPYPVEINESQNSCGGSFLTRLPRQQHDLPVSTCPTHPRTLQSPIACSLFAVTRDDTALSDCE